MADPRRILITSALPYINGIKHLGNLAGSMLPADIYARFQRLQGHEVTYICATDEHGTPAELAAQAMNIPVQQYCDEQYEVQKAAGEGFDLSYDWFGRSSRSANHELTQQFAHDLEAAGLIEERVSKQVYSVDDGRFLPDRYVEGTCPHCEFEKARGDQCDNCGRLLDPTDLKNPYSAVSGGTNIEVRDTRHLFLLQSKLQDAIRNWIDKKGDAWPQLARSIALKWLDEGLRDRAITRDLSWGVKVTNPDGSVREGFENKVFYVWFDAPIEYIAATKEWGEANEKDWEALWDCTKGADDTEYVQFMGKDNVPFHTLSFPATIMGSAEPWKLVDYIKSFNYLNYDGGQFSTSQGRGVFQDQALEILPADYWRWWLLSHAPESSDAEFTWEAFQTDANKDLADVLGNFVSRVTKFCRSKFSEAVPDGGSFGPAEAKLIADLTTRIRAYEGFMDAMEVRKSAAELRAIWVLGNEYLQAEAPWSVFKEDPDKAAAQIRLALNLIRVYAVLSATFIPEASAKMLSGMNTLDTSWPDDVYRARGALCQDHRRTAGRLGRAVLGGKGLSRGTNRTFTGKQANDFQ